MLVPVIVLSSEVVTDVISVTFWLGLEVND
jgi:hypothetical protein